MARDKSPLDGVVKFATTPEWQDKLTAVLRESTLPACEAVGIPPEALTARVNQDVYALLFTAVLEDLMSRRGENGENLTDDFLKRHGWKLGGTIRRLLTALRDSTLVLFEVTSVDAGTLQLRPVLTEAEPTTLASPALAQALEPGALVALRLLDRDGETTHSPGMLPFDKGMAEEAASTLAGTNTPPAITSFWLRKVLEEDKRFAGLDAPADEAAEY